MEFIHMFIKLTIGFILFFVLIRILGQKIIGQYSPYHFITAIVLSELLGNSIYQREVTITEIIFAIVVWGCLLFIIEYIFQKSLTIRQKLEGNPDSQWANRL